MILKENTALLNKLRDQAIKSNSKLKTEFASLNQFRMETLLTLNETYRPYDNFLRKAFIYRSIFFGLGGLFFFLGVYISEQSINWFPYAFIFANTLTAKNVVLALCLLFSVTAFGLNFLISAERDAVNQLSRRAKRKLARIYNKQNLIMESAERAAKLKKVYEDALHKIDEIEDSTKLLFTQIGKSKRENMLKLYHQTLLEANDELHLCVNNFKKMTLFFQS